MCFRNLEKRTNDAISLFGDKKARGIVLLKTFDEYYNGYKTDNEEVKWYTTLVKELQEKFPLWERILWEKAQKEFIKLYSAILKIRNILTTFDEFETQEILTERDVQDYHSQYIDLYNEFRKWKNNEKEYINDDLVFEMELIKQIEINIDYILELIKKFHQDNVKDKEILADINRAIESSVELRNKRDLINQFIQTLEISSSVDDDWIDFVEKKKREELEKIIQEEKLDHDETYKFVKNAFRDWNISTTWTGISKILPPVSRFSPGGERTQKRKTVLEKLLQFFDRFFDISRKDF